MNKHCYLASALLAGSFLLGGTALSAQERSVTLTTSKAVGSEITLLVNLTNEGVTVDWGDGNPQTYVDDNDPIAEIKGTVKGSTIRVSSNKTWTMFSCAGCGVTSIDLSNARDLESLYCQDNALETIDLKDMNALRDFNAANNALTAIEYTKASYPESDLKAIENFNVANNKLSGTFVIRAASLRAADISNNAFTTTYLTSNPNLDMFICSDNQIKTLNASKCTSLSTLVCNGNGITSLTLPTSTTTLQQLVIDDNAITATLDLSGNASLYDLSVANNGLSMLYLPAKTKLNTLNLSGNKLTFNALPLKAVMPPYISFMPQAKVDISGYDNVLDKDGVPYVALSTWATRTKEQLNINSLRYIGVTPSSSGMSEGTTLWYAVEASGDTIQLEQGKTSSAPNDYFVSSGKYTFFTPHGRAFARIMGNNAYKSAGFYIETSDIAIGEESTTGISTVPTTDDGLNVTAAHGTLTLTATAAAVKATVVGTDGRTVWTGTVDGQTTLSLPAVIYIVNGQKVAL